MTPEDARPGKDWIGWHAAYDDDTPLRHRLLAVQGQIRRILLERPRGPIRVVSACAGEARDLLGVLVDHPRARDIRGRLVELDSELAGVAAANAPPWIEVVCAEPETIVPGHRLFRFVTPPGSKSDTSVATDP